MGVEVVTAEQTALPIHASGHPAQDELCQLYQWVQPEIAIPVHGEPLHMQAHAELAKQTAVPKVLTGRNGDVFMLRPVPGIQRQSVRTGRLGYDKKQLISLS